VLNQWLKERSQVLVLKGARIEGVPDQPRWRL
jgi:hypothetical protein